MTKCIRCGINTDETEFLHNSCAKVIAERAREAGYDDGFDDGKDEGHGDSSARDVIELAKALRLGDIPRAEIALDLIAADIEGWTDLVANGRYNVHTRKAA